MKRTLTGLFVSMAMAGTLVAAQEASAPSAQSPDRINSSQSSDKTAGSSARSQDKASEAAPRETTLVGCLVQGSGPNVFLLQDAKASTDPASDRGKVYTIEASAAANGSPVDLKAQLNHRVSVVGLADASGKVAIAPVPDGKMDEKDLPKFSAKTVTKLADTCAATE